MTTFIESLATVILLLLLVLLFTHLMEGTANEWIMSKFKVAEDIV